MRTEVLDAWRGLVVREAHARFPEFSLSSKRVRGEPRGLLKFEWRPSEKLWCYIAFRPLDSEAFDALIAWSVRDRFPISDARTAEAPQDLENFDADFAIDWSLNFVPRSGAAHWNFWNPPDSVVEDPNEFALAYAAHFGRRLSHAEAEALVAPAVALGMTEVEKYGVPYLRRRALREAK